MGVPGAHLGVPACVAGRAQANEQRYSKLKEKYSELVQNHADLLRKVGSPKPPRHPLSQPCPPTPGLTVLPLCRRQNAEVTKQVTAARQAQGDVEREKKELEDSFQRVSEQAQRKVSGDAGGTCQGVWGGAPRGAPALAISLLARSLRSRQRCWTR